MLAQHLEPACAEALHEAVRQAGRGPAVDAILRLLAALYDASCVG